MNTGRLKTVGVTILKKWWCSIFLLPFIFYSLDQTYWTLTFNIFFFITYEFPFPLSIANIFVNGFLTAVHEAGHTLFGLFGWRTLGILGGSLLQLFMATLTKKWDIWEARSIIL